MAGCGEFSEDSECKSPGREVFGKRFHFRPDSLTLYVSLYDRSEQFTPRSRGSRVRWIELQPLPGQTARTFPNEDDEPDFGATLNPLTENDLSSPI